MHTAPFFRLVAVSSRLSSIALSVALWMAPGAANADPQPTDAQISAARDLFVAAEKDEDAARWSEAFEKLERVSAVKLTSGVRYHTALCEEHLGHLVAALRDYKAAAEQARSENATDVLRLVDKRVADSSERVPRLVVVLVPDLPDAAVSLDGEPIRAGSRVSVDPGLHTIEVRASGHALSTTAVALQEHDSTSIEVRLQPEATPTTNAVAQKPLAGARSETLVDAPRGDRTMAVAAAAVTLALVAGGIGAYLTAGAEHADAVERCAQVLESGSDACEGPKNAVRAWDWVTLGAWAGAAVAGTVSVASLVRMRHHGYQAAAPTQVVVGPATLGLRGTF